MTLYDKVKALAEKKGVPIYQVEKECGIGNGTVGKWTSKDSNPRIDTIRKLAEYFDVDVKEFLL